MGIVCEWYMTDYRAAHCDLSFRWSVRAHIESTLEGKIFLLIPSLEELCDCHS